MTKINGNYTSQPNNNFPMDCETLEYIQSNRQMVEILGNIAGDKVILYGCAASGVNRAPGYVFLKTRDFPTGEVLYFEGGSTTNGMYLESTAIAVTANAEPYSNAYTQRVLKPGIGSENYAWGDFVSLSDKSNRQLLTEINSLKAQIASLQPSPVGSIVMWPSNTIPTGWRLCDGSSLPRAEYQELFAVLQTTYGYNDSSSFKLPDMRGLYVAGKGANSYNALNQKGGANTVALSVNEMPKHNHTGYTGYDGKHKHSVDVYWKNGEHPLFGSTSDSATISRSTSSHDTSESNTHRHTISDQGGNAAHENRPPYIVLNYIIKVK